MTNIEINNEYLDITFTGWDRVWTLKERLSIPLSHVRRVAVQSSPPMNWKNLRAPGTSWPGKIRAGSYWSWETHEWSFWNIRKANRVVVIELEGEKYSRLVLEVDDPQRAMEMIDVAMMESRL
jgi:hypothetical protein